MRGISSARHYDARSDFAANGTVRISNPDTCGVCLCGMTSFLRTGAGRLYRDFRTRLPYQGAGRMSLQGAQVFY
ncbi:hypothetical protein MRX96_041766 [Rhipicephalus microplus]